MVVYVAVFLMLRFKATLSKLCVHFQFRCSMRVSLFLASLSRLVLLYFQPQPQPQLQPIEVLSLAFGRACGWNRMVGGSVGGLRWCWLAFVLKEGSANGSHVLEGTESFQWFSLLFYYAASLRV